MESRKESVEERKQEDLEAELKPKKLPSAEGIKKLSLEPEVKQPLKEMKFEKSPMKSSALQFNENIPKKEEAVQNELQPPNNLISKDAITKRANLIRIIFFMLLIHLMFCGVAITITIHSSMNFSSYSKILPNFMHRYGLFLSVFIVNLFATYITIIVIFRIHKYCFVNAVELAQSSELTLLQYELLISGGVSIICGCILFISSASWKHPIHNNILYSIQHAVKDNIYAEEINTIQQKFQCCGISVQSSKPQLIWLDYLQADIAFQENLYDQMGSIPWSCCKSNYLNMYCEQLAYERFIIPLNETLFERLPNYAARFKRNWDCVNLSNCKQKRMLGINSIYHDDCGVVFYRSFRLQFFYLNGTISIATGKPNNHLSLKEILTFGYLSV